MMKVAASILACDFSELKAELRKVETADFIHFDVMDGHFVPNLALSPVILEAVKKHTRLPVNAHLMVTDPKDYIDMFSKADIITVHVESNDVEEVLKKIKHLKKKAGIALNPETPAEKVIPFLPMVDSVLVMTVRPGFAGQKFLPTTAEKTKLLKPTGKEIWVDGGITDKTKPLVDADVLCAGEFIFASKNPEDVIRKLKK